MSEKILEVVKTMDFSYLCEFLEEDAKHLKRFCQIYDGEEVFLQLALDSYISMETYYEAEKGIQKMCRSIYEDNSCGNILGYIVAEEEDIRNGFYSIDVLTSEEKDYVCDRLENLIKIDSLENLQSIVKLGCREISKSIIYCEEKSILLIVDGIGGLIWCRDHDYTLDKLFAMEKSFNINYRFDDEW